MQFKQVEGGGGGGKLNWLKIAGGQSVSGVFVGEPLIFYVHDKGMNQGYSICAGDGCEECARGEKKSFKFRINFVTKENGIMVAKVFEKGVRVYKTMAAVNADYPLDQWMVKISREGAGKDDTTYNIMPLPNGELTEAQIEALSSVEMNDLTPVGAGHAKKAPAASSNDLPF